MATKTKKHEQVCPTCQKKTGEAGHLCVPARLSHKKCDWCGAFIPNVRHLCDKKLRDVTYICNSCGRTAVKPEFLCKPQRIK